MGTEQRRRASCVRKCMRRVEAAGTESPSGLGRDVVVGQPRTTFREAVEFLGKVLSEGRPYWGQGGSDEGIQLVSLAPGTREFGEIAARFRKTLPQATLVRIDRVQNGPLYDSFLLQVETLKKRWMPIGTRAG